MKKVSEEYRAAQQEFVDHVDNLMTLAKIDEEDVAELRKAYYELPDNSVGGSLHITLDDFNWERRHVESCRMWAIEREDRAGERFADLLLTLTDEQLRAWLGPGSCGTCGADYGDEHRHFNPPFTTDGGRCPACGARPAVSA